MSLVSNNTTNSVVTQQKELGSNTTMQVTELQKPTPPTLPFPTNNQVHAPVSLPKTEITPFFCPKIGECFYESFKELKPFLKSPLKTFFLLERSVEAPEKSQRVLAFKSLFCDCLGVAHLFGIVLITGVGILPLKIVYDLVRLLISCCTGVRCRERLEILACLCSDFLLFGPFLLALPALGVLASYKIATDVVAFLPRLLGSSCEMIICDMEEFLDD